MCSTAFKLCFQLQLAPLQGGAAGLVGIRKHVFEQRRRAGAAGPWVLKIDPTLALFRLSGTFRHFQLLKLEYDKLLSNFAFDFNLRNYTKGGTMDSLRTLFDKAGGTAETHFVVYSDASHPGSENWAASIVDMFFRRGKAR